LKKHPLLVDIESVKPYPLVESKTLYEIRPPAMQIDQCLPVGGVMGITSQPGVGKTWLTMEIARAVSSGTPFLGKFESNRGGVLFVGSDSSLNDYAQQWSRLTRTTSEGSPGAFEPVRFLIQSSFIFEDRDEVRQLIRTHQQFEWGEVTHEPGTNLPHRERGFHVIVFDTVSRLTRARQNDNTEMEEVFRNIRAIAEITGAAVVLLHHNPKRSEFNDGEGWRGATSQEGALDSWIQLTPSRRSRRRSGSGS
jgi:RecA-family ATPase